MPMASTKAVDHVVRCNRIVILLQPTRLSGGEPFRSMLQVPAFDMRSLFLSSTAFLLHCLDRATS